MINIVALILIIFHFNVNTSKYYLPHTKKVVSIEGKIFSNIENKSDLLKDSFPHFRITEKLNEEMIEEVIFEFLNSQTGEVQNTFNIYNENPFRKIGLKTIPNEDSSEFFFVSAPGSGKRSDFNDLFGPMVNELIPDYNIFKKLYCSYTIDHSSKKFISVAYLLDMHLDYYEIYGNGYSSSKIIILDSLGNVTFQKILDGGLVGQSVTSADGKYAAYLYTITPYWNNPQRTIFEIVNTYNNKIVYQEENNNLISDSRIWLNVEKDIVSTILIGPENGSLYYLSSREDRLYKTKEKIKGLYTVWNSITDRVEIGFREEPSRFLYFNKDFDVINL